MKRQASQDVENLPSRTYTVIAHFVGGETYNEARGNATFDVIKYSPALQINGLSYYGWRQCNIQHYCCK